MGGGHTPCAYDGDGALNYTTEFVDEVWSLALALNNSITVLEENNLSLSDYQYGQKAVTVEYVLYAHDVI